MSLNVLFCSNRSHTNFLLNGSINNILVLWFLCHYAHALATCSGGLGRCMWKNLCAKSALPSQIVMICGSTKYSDIFEISDRLVLKEALPQNLVLAPSASYRINTVYFLFGRQISKLKKQEAFESQNIKTFFLGSQFIIWSFQVQAISIYVQDAFCPGYCMWSIRPFYAYPKFGNTFGEFVRHRKDVTKMKPHGDRCLQTLLFYE